MMARWRAVSVTILTLLMLLSCGEVPESPSDHEFTARSFSSQDTVTPRPTASPGPTVTATKLRVVTYTPKPVTPAVQATLDPACKYAMAYVKDVTIPDGTWVKPGQKFTKTWAVKNTGGCAWSAALTLRQVSGEKMESVLAPLPLAQPGEIVNMSVDLEAPAVPGDYKGVWQLCSDSGCYQGIVTVVITVGGDPTSTHTVRPTVAPTNTLRPAVVAAPAPTRRCCKICTTGKACGNSCISRRYTCHQPPGCACDG
jgi:hypothetical protein